MRRFFLCGIEHSDMSVAYIPHERLFEKVAGEGCNMHVRAALPVQWRRNKPTGFPIMNMLLGYDVAGAIFITFPRPCLPVWMTG